MSYRPTMTLTQTRIAEGWWEGELTGAGDRVLTVEAWCADRQIDGVQVTPVQGRASTLSVRVPIPPSILNEGLQTVLLRVGGDVLARFALVAGQPLDEDLRAEISLLRAELDLLKRAFRRHCAETAG